MRWPRLSVILLARRRWQAAKSRRRPPKNRSESHWKRSGRGPWPRSQAPTTLCRALEEGREAMAPAEQRYDFDWLVIGSGFGGSVSALRLSEKGYSVGVLECGRRFADHEFPKNTGDVRRYFWSPKLGMKGIFRLTPFSEVFVLSGSGVGGGSLVYANTLYQPKPESMFYRDPQWAR